MTETKKKTIELWEGYEVEVNEQLFKDTDFLFDLSAANKAGDIEGTITMMFAVVGGEEVYEKVRAHIVEKYGYFDVDALRDITDKIDSCFPKAGNRASRRQKWTRQ